MTELDHMSHFLKHTTNRMPCAMIFTEWDQKVKHYVAVYFISFAREYLFSHAVTDLGKIYLTRKASLRVK